MNTEEKEHSSFHIDIDIRDQNWIKHIPSIEEDTHSIIQRILTEQLPSTEHVEISIVLTDNPFIQKLNHQYRNKDKPTNVLSFPQTEADEMNTPFPFISLGDIIVAFETIQNEASEQNKTIKNHYTHMLVHGCLHLLHYDHETEEDAKEMEALETQILDHLGIKNPYEEQ
ncbi:MAG: rRNA maturation RNase YbeY [Alphaproteobacteria bacterium]